MAERFVHEFSLDPTPAQARILRIRLDLARQLYNAFLGEALNVVRLGEWFAGTPRAKTRCSPFAALKAA
jgi:hypothetical protein